MNTNLHSVKHARGMAMGPAVYLALAALLVSPVYARYAPLYAIWMWVTGFAVMYWHFALLWTQDRLGATFDAFPLWKRMLHSFVYPVEAAVTAMARRSIRRGPVLRARRRHRNNVEVWN